MKVRLLPSAPDQPTDHQYLTTFVINDCVAIDAGCLGLSGNPELQANVGQVFLSHSHADHVASLPIFLENIYGMRDVPVAVWGGSETLASLREDMFNERLWPDFIALSRRESTPLLELRTLVANEPVEACGLRITPIEVNHTVPTFGFVVEEGQRAVIFGCDSGPTDRLWQAAAGLEQLDAVFLEASFPNAMQELATKSHHLTPAAVQAEIGKMPADSRVIAIHIKPRFRTQVIAELQGLGIAGLEIGVPGRTYDF